MVAESRDRSGCCKPVRQWAGLWYAVARADEVVRLDRTYMQVFKVLFLPLSRPLSLALPPLLEKEALFAPLSNPLCNNTHFWHSSEDSCF